jgi:hypothetical protein
MPKALLGSHNLRHQFDTVLSKGKFSQLNFKPPSFTSEIYKQAVIVIMALRENTKPRLNAPLRRYLLRVQISFLLQVFRTYALLLTLFQSNKFPVFRPSNLPTGPKLH